MSLLQPCKQTYYKFLDCLISKNFDKTSGTWSDPPTKCLSQYEKELEKCKGAYYELSDRFEDPDTGEIFGATAIAGGFTRTGDKNYYLVLPDDEKPKGMKNTYPVHPINCKVCNDYLKSLTRCALPFNVEDVTDPFPFDDIEKAYEDCIADYDSPLDAEMIR